MDTERRLDNQLVQRAARGDMDAFGEIVERYRLRVLRTAHGIVGSSDEAEDIAQEVFVKAWQAIDTFRPGGSLASWLYRITTNAAIDATRRRRPQVALDDIAPPLSSQHTERSILDAEEAARVQQAIQNLPPASRAALVLREYEQLSYAEIADVLNIPMGTVMSRLHYARQALKKALSSQEGRDDV
ncbi:MAG: sigma-70 family RNA polymerase sigma factor [Anaerolineae bacterium]|nr:sigma-70 family RNA polymerase sigma factor [Anaerolineae bacterium]